MGQDSLSILELKKKKKKQKKQNMTASVNGVL